MFNVFYHFTNLPIYQCFSFVFCLLLICIFLFVYSAGPESIMEASGRDATETFLAVHSLPMLEELRVVGILEK
jgi:hypothetical protein